MANQLRVFNVVGRPTKALKQLRKFFEVRFGYRIKHLQALINDMDDWKLGFNDIQERNKLSILLGQLITLNNKFDNFDSQFPFHEPCNHFPPHVQNTVQEIFQNLQESGIFTLESIPLLIEASNSFLLIEDHLRCSLSLKIIKLVIQKEKHYGVLKVEMFIQYLIYSSHINLNNGLFAAAYLQTVIAKQLIEQVYKFKYQQYVCIKSLLASASVTMFQQWLSMNMTILKLSTNQEMRCDPFYRWVDDFYKKELDMKMALNQISDAHYYTSIAFAPTTYEMAECSELMGIYFLHNQEYTRGKEHFVHAHNALKDKLGLDSPHSINLAILILVAETLDLSSSSILTPNQHHHVQENLKKLSTLLKEKKLNSLILAVIGCWLTKILELLSDTVLTREVSEMVKKTWKKLESAGHLTHPLSIIVLASSGSTSRPTTNFPDHQNTSNPSVGPETELSNLLLQKVIDKDVEECRRIWNEEVTIFPDWIHLHPPDQ
eukprot:TRINITY_DN6729_c0_g1_i2.p1 TRINITY_DN6729_c0_g1~~TRINITY_DN6729_c0_g1_i2.p1  ORF type:complete len:517 (-),score=131.60 TRINITY_DN6729_c0_g1_i2:15-1481(-)